MSELSSTEPWGNGQDPRPQDEDPEINEACERFLDASKQGKRPDVEAFVPKDAYQERAKKFRVRLIAEELGLRTDPRTHEPDDPVDPDEYRKVSEFIEGASLRQRLKSGLPSFRQAAEWTAALCDALTSVHKLGLFHRDIKPDNIRIDPEGMPHLLDFGLALSEEERGLGTGEVVGTLAYMSPEQAGGKSPVVDGRADIYSLGAVLYAMLAARQAPRQPVSNRP